MKQVKLLFLTSLALVSIFIAGCAKNTTTAPAALIALWGNLNIATGKVQATHINKIDK